MPTHTKSFCISVTFLQPTFHGKRGKGDNAEPEWPPSPLRVFQALVAGAAARSGERKELMGGRYESTVCAQPLADGSATNVTAESYDGDWFHDLTVVAPLKLAGTGRIWRS